MHAISIQQLGERGRGIGREGALCLKQSIVFSHLDYRKCVKVKILSIVLN
jgi:hypothetical protein